jgi:hypothetical protein
VDTLFGEKQLEPSPKTTRPHGWPISQAGKQNQLAGVALNPSCPVSSALILLLYGTVFPGVGPQVGKPKEIQTARKKELATSSVTCSFEHLQFSHRDT